MTQESEAPDGANGVTRRLGTGLVSGPESPLTGAFERVRVIVNPASGRNRPILNTLNDVLGAAGVDWDVAVTKPHLSARELAARAVDEGADLVAIYGGDGTVMEAAAGLIGSDVPMAVLPGGTSNALSLSLGVPGDLATAAGLLLPGQARLQAVDIGRLEGRYFLVAVGLGIAGELAAAAEREDKDRFGTLAYLARGLQALGRARSSIYRLTLDGQEVEVDGVTCIVANTGGFGLPGLSLAPTIYLDDGMLDIMVIRDTDIGSILSLAASVLQLEESQPRSAGDEVPEGETQATRRDLVHWQARDVRIVADPPQAIQADGEVLEPGPIHAAVLPRAVRILVPVGATLGL